MPPDLTHNARLADLDHQLWWLYRMTAVGRLRSPAAVADLTAWANLGRVKPPVNEPPEAA